jgi:chromosome segregation ATPase
MTQIAGTAAGAVIAHDSMQEHKELREAQKAESELNLNYAKADYDKATKALKANDEALKVAETNVEGYGKQFTRALGLGKKGYAALEDLKEKLHGAKADARAFAMARTELELDVETNRRRVELAKVPYRRFH